MRLYNPDSKIDNAMLEFGKTHRFITFILFVLYLFGVYRIGHWFGSKIFGNELNNVTYTEIDLP